MSRRPEPVQPEINVTPLVDVVLVLLIIFMVITPKMESGPSIELPEVKWAEKQGEAKVEPILVTVDAAGTAWIDQEEVEAGALEAALRRTHEADPYRRLVIKADRSSRWERARQVFQASQAIGFKGVSLQVTELAAGTPRG